MRARQKRNTITSLLNSQGQKVTKVSEMCTVAADFYKNLLGRENSLVVAESVDYYRDLLKHKLVPDQVAHLSHLCDPVTAEEVRKVIFGFNPDKIPGPDGYNVRFFQASWEVVGEEITAAIQHCFQSKLIPREVNATILALIPKVPNPEDMKNFRPISCCNLIYKCISMIVANRFSALLLLVISKNQTAFVKGRVIGENILLAHELVHKYAMKGISGRSALKIDLMKAFNSVSWQFLMHVLIAMGIHANFVEWISMCVTCPVLSVAFKGGLMDYFPAKQVMEIFSCLLDREADAGRFPYHPMCRKIRLTHICFVDDLLLFSDGSNYGIQSVQRVLEVFHRLSGLQSNPSKCEIFFGGMSKDEMAARASRYGYKVGGFPVRYLGVPLVAGKLSASACKPLESKVTHVGDGVKLRAKIAWKYLVYPKKEGGLGLRDQSTWNNAGVCRQLWALMLQQGSLWVAWIHAYKLKGRDLWTIQVSGSWNWKKLLKSSVADTGRLILHALLSHIWRERCKRIFGEQQRSAAGLVRVIKAEVVVMAQDPG